MFVFFLRLWLPCEIEHFYTFQRSSIKPGTRNIPEHAGTFRNIPEHEKIKIIFMKKKKFKNKMIFVKINNNVK